jgi:poly-beta-1,6-N-acetyl-D-glucosamine N-deacetylase
MQASGLVEVATHTWDLHQGHPGQSVRKRAARGGDPQVRPGNRNVRKRVGLPARIRGDLERASRRIEEELGRRPRAVVWPYGEYSEVTEELARELGMPVSMGLVPGNQPVDQLSGMRRFVIMGNMPVEDLAWFVRRSSTPSRRCGWCTWTWTTSTTRTGPGGAEPGCPPGPDRGLGPSHVYLQAFADPEGDGTARALYFPNRHLPVRADLFNRVAWQLRTRAGVRVFAWMPLLAFDLGDAERTTASRSSGGRETAVPSRPDYRRLSPWEPEARRIISEIYEDLAVHAAFDGILFHDDAYLNDREDASAFPREPGRLPTVDGSGPMRSSTSPTR